MEPKQRVEGHVLVDKRIPLPLQASGACVNVQNIYESGALISRELAPPRVCVLKKIQTGLFCDGDVVNWLDRNATIETPLGKLKPGAVHVRQTLND